MAIPRVDVEHKVDGSAIYPIDVRLDGMVYAAVQACPVPQGKLMSYDFDAVKDRPGVIAAVELPQVAEELANSDMRSGVAVVADTYYRAKTALSLMPIEWDYGPGADNSYDKMTAAAQNLLGKEAEHAEEVRGDPRPILASATNVVTGDYSRPFEAHATMCPPSAGRKCDGGPGRRLELHPERFLDAAARRRAGRARSQRRLRPCLLSGRRLRQRQPNGRAASGSRDLQADRATGQCHLGA